MSGADHDGRRWTGRAPAKVNLGLAITHRRADGYHELASVFVRLGLADTLTVTRADAHAPGAADRLAIEGDPDCPLEGNLVLRAITALRVALAVADAAAAGTSAPGLAVELRKRTPMAGGLAGGSTDAATSLRLAAAAWGVGPDVGLAPIGARLGADVPFFLGGHGAAVVTGIGEVMAPLPPLATRVGVLLLTPPFGLSTAAVFAMSDRLPPPGPEAAGVVRSLEAAWRQGLDGAALSGWAGQLRDANDLWPAAAAVDPRMVGLRELVEEVLGRPALLTGSGSTLVALYPSAEAARAAADDIAATGRMGRAGFRVRATSDDQPHREDPA